MARPITPAVRVRRLKRFLTEGSLDKFLSELMILGIEANELEDYKVSPRNLFEMAELMLKIKKLEAGGKLKEEDSWLQVIEGGKNG
jgi:hypothetical protein